MKKLIILIISIASLYAAELNTMDEYNKALKYYNNKDYKQAYEIFSKLSDSMVNQKRLNFYLGRSAYELGNYEAALAAFDRVTMEDPENLRVHLELAQTYLKLGLNDEAKKELELLKDSNIPQNIRDHVERQIAVIDASKKSNFFNFTAIAGMLYDTNIENGTDVSQYSVYVPQLDSNFDVTTKDEVAAAAYELGLVTQYIKKMSDEFVFDNSLTLYANNYFNPTYKNKNMQIASFKVTPTYIQQNYTFGFNMFFDHIWYGQVNYMNNFALMPEYNRKINDNYIYKGALRYARKQFIQTANNYGNPAANPSNDTERNSNTYEVINEISYIGESTGLSKLNLLLGREAQLKDIRYDVNRAYMNIIASNNFPINQEFLLSTSLGFNYVKYEDFDTSFQKHRKDWKYDANIGLMYSLNKSTSLNVSYKYINQISNAQPYDYSKHVVKTNLYYRF
jgi:hypothetical protein